MSNIYVAEGEPKKQYMNDILDQVSAVVEDTKEFLEYEDTYERDRNYSAVRTNISILIDHLNVLYSLVDGKYYG